MIPRVAHPHSNSVVPKTKLPEYMDKKTILSLSLSLSPPQRKLYAVFIVASPALHVENGIQVLCINAFHATPAIHLATAVTSMLRGFCAQVRLIHFRAHWRRQ